MINNPANEAFSNLRLFAANSHPELAQEISEHMGVELSKSTVSKFSDGEISVSIWESVRGKDCFIIQSTCEPVNDNIMELLIMADALRRASARSVTAVIPYYGYARQDRKAKARDPITSKLIANMITAAGIGRVITMDLHAAQEQGFFDIPVDHMLGQPMLTDYFKLKDLEDMVVVSPDHGSVTRARNMAKPFNVPIAIIDKRRPEPNKSEIMNIIGDVTGKNCVILDDMIDTAGTISEQRMFTRARHTPFFPDRLSNASRRARSKRWCSSIRYLSLKKRDSKRSQFSLRDIYSRRPYREFIQTSRYP